MFGDDLGRDGGHAEALAGRLGRVTPAMIWDMRFQRRGSLLPVDRYTSDPTRGIPPRGRREEDVLIAARFHTRGIVAGIACALLSVAPLSAQSVGYILSQPARDVGLAKTRIPPLLVRTSEAPYSTAGTGSCAAIAESIAALTHVIGPDFSTSPSTNRQNMAEIGSSAIVNSLIPFRGIVREVSGASAAERRKTAAIDAGIARRGFLRGLQSARRCRR
ncbi:hypothetical protein [Sphingomonas sp. CROZ-RG-20F-R02-07]|uniref:hypothetical protein n=1 Tax=Sphingomonas sp. CROZ-RG-20F-R02-07 TaxID=2914832 RepID=UPI001F5A98C3|nr:hypothetical protein [Sphingomonas sp. CROZ-RG-20F-R02-07]